MLLLLLAGFAPERCTMLPHALRPSRRPDPGRRRPQALRSPGHNLKVQRSHYRRLTHAQYPHHTYYYYYFEDIVFFSWHHKRCGLRLRSFAACASARQYQRFFALLPRPRSYLHRSCPVDSYPLPSQKLLLRSAALWRRSQSNLRRCVHPPQTGNAAYAVPLVLVWKR